MILARGASLSYEDHGKTIFACKDIDLEVKRGEFLGILGPSGSGKSSLLFLLSGLKVPSSGSIMLDNRSLDSFNDSERSQIRLERFGFIFQHPFLLGYLSAEENVLAAANSDRNQKAVSLLAALGLAEKRNRRPHELSGGEKQRVCVARALINDPEVIFADEPTASLDHKNGMQVVEMLIQLRGQGALVMVTHDESMLEHANRIVRIVDGEISSNW